MVVLATLDYNIDVVATRVHVKELLAKDETSFSFLDTDWVVMCLVQVSSGECTLILNLRCQVYVHNRARVLAIPLHEVFPLVHPSSGD